MSFTMLLNLTVYQSIFAKALTLKQRVADSGEITEGERDREQRSASCSVS